MTGNLAFKHAGPAGAHDFGPGPAPAPAFSAALIASVPLDERAHTEIRRQLEEVPTVFVPAE